MSSKNSESNVEVPAAPRGYKVVQTPFEVRGGARRSMEAITVRPTGLCTSNALASEIMDKVAAKSGADPVGYLVVYGVDEANSVVVIYPTKKDEPGSMQVRRYKRSKSVSVHMGGVFREYPNLRPVVTKQCRVVEAVDPNGVPCVLVSLGAGLAKAKRRAGGAGATPVEEEEATD